MKKRNARSSYRVVEFFSGIGGMRAACQLLENNCSQSSRLCNCSPCFSHVAAFDFSTVANEVYANSYIEKNASKGGKFLLSQKPIESVSAERLDQLGGDIWMMSPPCQPHTRNNQTEKRDLRDKRSASFTHLTVTLRDMKNKPLYILIENVVGFEKSNACAQWLESVKSCGYDVVQFILCPTQFGTPNVRPRYFCICRLAAHPFRWAPSLSRKNICVGLGALKHQYVQKGWLPKKTRLIREFLTGAPGADLQVPLKVLQKPSSTCVDLVCASSDRSCCFTKSYGKYMKGTGSILVQDGNAGGEAAENLLGGKSGSLEELTCKEATRHSRNIGKVDSSGRDLKRPRVTAAVSTAPTDGHASASQEGCEPWYRKFGDRLRFFAPVEIARLLGFTETLRFPATITRRKKYALLGNSLHVPTVATLLHILTCDCESPAGRGKAQTTGEIDSLFEMS